MTFIVGFDCFDGIVLCADQQEGDGVTKRYVNKLYSCNIGSEWSVAVGASGDSGIIKSFWSKLQHLLGNESYDRFKTEATIQRAYDHMRGLHPDARMDLLVSICAASPLPDKHIYKTESYCLAPQKEFCCVGMDTTLAYFLLESIHDPLMGVDELVKLGVFVTSLMKKHADGVGGLTDVLIWRQGSTSFEALEQDYISSIEDAMEAQQIYDVLYNQWRAMNPDIHRPLGLLRDKRRKRK